MTEEVYSVRGAARRVRRSRWTIQRWMRHGMPHRRISDQHVEIDEAELTAWLRRSIINQKSSRFASKI